MMSYEFWDRDSLYEEVWATPMARLAKKYGISDVGLAKVCRKLAVPVPGRGYWAKKEAGQAVQRIPLPALKEPIRLYKPTPKPEEPKIESFTTPDERAQVAKAKERDPQLILKRGSLSHPLIAQAREVLGRSDCDGHGLLWTNDPCLEISVSKSALPRALRLAAGLIAALEEEGFKIAVKQGRKEKTTATLHGQEIGFTLVEKVDRIPLATPPKGGVLQRVLTYAGTPHEQKPSGRLGLQIWKPWNTFPKSWNDGKTRTLEDLLPEIVAAFLRIALAEKAECEKRAAERAEAERLAAERARQAALIKQEEARVRALLRAAANWERARRIRDLVSAACDGAQKEGVSVDPGTAFGDWLIWATRQADRIDPLKVSPTSIIDSKPAPEPQAGYYGYRKPDPPMRFPKPLWKDAKS
jgi:hypothetical protein